MNGKLRSLFSPFERLTLSKSLTDELTAKYGSLPLSLVSAGLLMLFAHSSLADQSFNDDVIVKGSLCVGTDCNVGENFTFDTIRMKENNLRIRFTDTSASSGFPTRDWEITANESSNGGIDYFAIQDITNDTIPFKLLGALSTDSLVMATRGIGFGTVSPQAELHAKAGNSPTLRLQQDGSSGFAARTWDVGGNETNFFVRDVDNNASLPLRIAAGATSAAIFVAADGDVGFETTTPDGMFDIAHPSNVNDHALLIAADAKFGLNVSNGFVPRGQFDVQTTNGVSQFMVQTDGKVGIGLGTSGTANGLFDIQVSGVSKFTVDNSSNVGIGTASVSGRLDIRNAANTTSVFTVSDTGRVGIGTTSVPESGGKATLLNIAGEANKHGVMAFDSPTANFTSAIRFTKAGALQWEILSRNDFGSEYLSLDNKNGVAVMFWSQDQKVGFGGVSTVAAGNVIEHSNGAALTSGGTWANGSSRALKKDIRDLSLSEAQTALEELEPVTFEYLKEPGETYAGFIAEDVPEIVASSDRKKLATMDVVAVLTKVLKEQQNTIEKLNERIEKLEADGKL